MPWSIQLIFTPITAKSENFQVDIVVYTLVQLIKCSLNLEKSISFMLKLSFFSREDVVRYMLEHRDDFEPFVEDDISFDQHIRLVTQFIFPYLILRRYVWVLWVILWCNQIVHYYYKCYLCFDNSKNGTLQEHIWGGNLWRQRQHCSIRAV